MGGGGTGGVAVMGGGGGESWGGVGGGDCLCEVGGLGEEAASLRQVSIACSLPMAS